MYPMFKSAFCRDRRSSEIPPVVANLEYLIRCTSREADKSIFREGLSRCQRLHIHYYECARRGVVLAGNAPGGGGACSEVGILYYRRAREFPPPIIQRPWPNGLSEYLGLIIFASFSRYLVTLMLVGAFCGRYPIRPG